MLYDQAQLVDSYVSAYQITQMEIYQKAARDICVLRLFEPRSQHSHRKEYVLRFLTSGEGGFYSAEDAGRFLRHELHTHAYTHTQCIT